jgi:putative glutamine amidotransferase
MKEKRVIAVSKLAPNYENWLRMLCDEAEIIDLYRLSLEDIRIIAKKASGILLSGGADVHSSLYGRKKDTAFCKNVDHRRDILELAVIEIALDGKVPLLGICRGQQILNVALKGSLYPDIPEFCRSPLVHSSEEGDVTHSVEIKKDSYLSRITGVRQGIVNSAHHQAISRVASGFVVSANSSDNIIEAIEATESLGHPFCIAVQWHPERMVPENPLSGKLGMAFIEASKMKAGEI